MHKRSVCLGILCLLFFLAPRLIRAGDEVLFEDNFDHGLSDKWQVVGLKKEDYRVRNGALEMRVHSGDQTRKTPRLNVFLPFSSSGGVTALVDVTVLDEFTQEKEFAGVFLIDETGAEFAAKKQRIGDKLVFAPGNYEFRGKPGEKGDVKKYDVHYTAVTDDAGPLRIIVSQNYAYFQVGPSSEDQYLNFFFSAIRKESTERGFCLMAAGAPPDSNHWVRFDNFKVIRR